MKYFYGFVVLVLLILAVDCAIGTYIDYRRERKRQADMDKYAMSPFRGSKKFDDGMFL